MSKNPEYTFGPKPPTVGERFSVAGEFWKQLVSEEHFQSRFENPELTDGKLFAITKKLQLGQEESLNGSEGNSGMQGSGEIASGSWGRFDFQPSIGSL